MNKNKAIIVGVIKKSEYYKKNEFLYNIEELKSLCYTANININDTIVKTINKYNPAYLLNKGNLLTIKEKISSSNINLIIFENHLAGNQIKNLEKFFKITVIDRQDLILDIFQKHAKTKEAYLQIELARLELMLPRLQKMWEHLDRQYGGIGAVRGEGEKQIERDKRDIKKKISQIKKKLQKIEKTRILHSKGRKNILRIAIVGYTNTGKSTLLNTLTKANTYADNKLFATLDPRTKLWVIDNYKVLLTDTIGFIRNLPHKLIASFKSTLLEAQNADLIWNIIDASSDFINEQNEVVLQTLKEIGIKDTPIWNIYNKIDKLNYIPTGNDEKIYISGLKKIGLDQLKENIIKFIIENKKKACLITK